MYQISNKALSRPLKNAICHPQDDLHNNKQAGFTLLELLLVLVLMGIILAISIGGIGMLQEENTLQLEAKKIIHSITDARNRAILLNDTVLLELHKTQIRILHKKDPLYVVNLQGTIAIKAMNGKSLEDGANIITIHHLGIVDESSIWLEQGTKRVTLYLPAIGRPKIYDEHVSLPTIHEELL